MPPSIMKKQHHEYNNGSVVVYWGRTSEEGLYVSIFNLDHTEELFYATEYSDKLTEDGLITKVSACGINPSYVMMTLV